MSGWGRCFICLEPAIDRTRLALKAFTDQNIATHKPLLARSSSETLDEPPKDHGFHSSRDIRSGSGGAVAPDRL
ncbi:hypothetical protein Tco_0982561 [Tanacetum coccineum]